MTSKLLHLAKDACVGCFGCFSSCPFDAVEMRLDDYGFYYPYFDSSKCKNCGKCENYCPVLNYEYSNWVEPEVFAARSNDFELLMKGSSGGIFGEIALSVLQAGGVVYGAGWDDNFQLRHVSVDCPDKLEKLFGSKYVQSYTGKVYSEIITLAKRGRFVLFCGTPCQVAALKIAINKMEDVRQNIILCDLICQGVGSSAVFRKYLDHHKKKFCGDITSISFRSKKHGWMDFSMEICFSNHEKYICSRKFDPYLVGYSNALYLRPSCYDCPFSKIPRQGDITLGDFWRSPKEVYNHWGTSLVVINNQWGKKVFDRVCKERKIEVKAYLLDAALQSNKRLSCGKLSIPDNRADFFSDLKCQTFDRIIEGYLKRNISVDYLKHKVNQYVLWGLSSSRLRRFFLK